MMHRVLLLTLSGLHLCGVLAAQCPIASQDFESIPTGTIVTTLPLWRVSSTPASIAYTVTVETSPTSSSRALVLDRSHVGIDSITYRLPIEAHLAGSVSVDLIPGNDFNVSKRSRGGYRARFPGSLPKM
jgi:hypothetical protein